MRRRLSPAELIGCVAIGGIALLSGLVTWRAGASPSADGVAYLDLSDAALSGRWHEFINAYWSPLFPVLVAMARAVIGQSAAREVTAIELVNAAAATLSAVCFSSILRSLERRSAVPAGGVAATGWRLVSWAAFAAVVLRIVPLTLSTPDLLVVLAQLAALAALLLLSETGLNRFAWAAGAALAAGFLAKGAVLVLSASYFVALALLVPRARLFRSTLMMAGGFAVVAAPWIVLLSRHEGTLTAGSVARLNLAWYVGGQSSQSPNPDAAGMANLANVWKHSVATPSVYDFSAHAVGTYPPWTDPTWSHSGLTPAPTLARERQVLRESTALIWSVFAVSFIAWALVSAGLRARTAVTEPRLSAALALLAGAQAAVYWPVHVEVRFLGVAWLFAWLAASTIAHRGIGRPRLPVLAAVAVIAAGAYVAATPAMGSPRELAAALALAIAVVAISLRRDWHAMFPYAVLVAAACTPWCANTINRLASGAGPVHRRDVAVLRALHDAGVPDGAAVASVNATFPASWARLGRWRVVAEVAHSRTREFWQLDSVARAPILRALTASGALVIVGILDSGANVPLGWTAVPGTGAVFLPSPGPRRR